MASAILFICRSCHGSEQRPSDQPTDGAALCDHLMSLHSNWGRKAELEVRGVNCLWTCDHPCSMALTAESKATYALAKVMIREGELDAVANAALQLGERYLDCQSSPIPWKQIPELLQTDFVACIPPARKGHPGEAE
jgi:predicted metal-binding protein